MSAQSLKSWIRRRPALHAAIKTLMAHALDPLCRLRGRPVARIPGRLRAAFTLGGRAKVLYAYVDGAKSQPLVYDRAIIDATCARVAAGEFGHYGGIDGWLYEALKRHSIRDQRVVIMGSADQGHGPWYECVCLHYGGRPTTIDYNPIDFQDNRISFLKAPLAMEKLEPFDAAFSISSFEHDGLGRYGDPLDPDADIKAMKQMRQLIKKGGLLFLTVPVGQDKVVFNLHRIYGRARLPLLLAGWTLVEVIGHDESLLDRDTGFGWNPTGFVKGAAGWEEKLLHPGYPEHGPVWVLRQDREGA